MSDAPRSCCPDADRTRELIVLETTGELTFDEARALELVVARCPECRVARDTYARTAAALDLALADDDAFAVEAGVPSPRALGGPPRGVGADSGRAFGPARTWPQAYARAAAIAFLTSAAVGAGYMAGARQGELPAPLDARAEPPPLAPDPERTDPRVVPSPPVSGSGSDPDPVIAAPPTPDGAAPSDPALALATVCRRELTRLGNPEFAASARAFLAVQGRSWLLHSLHATATPTDLLVGAARAVLSPLSREEAAALLDHADPRLHGLALDLGARPEAWAPPAHGHLNAWWKLAAGDDATLAGRAAELLLALGPRAILGGGEPDAAAGYRPIADWPAAFADRVLAHRDWPPALAAVWAEESPNAEAARALLARLPSPTVLALLDESIASLQSAEASAAHGDPALARASDSARALAGILAERPSGPSLPAIARALEVPALAPLATSVLERWAATEDARVFALGLIAHSRPGVRRWVDHAQGHAGLLVELARIDPGQPLSRAALVAAAPTRHPAIPALVELYLASDDPAVLAGLTAALVAGPTPYRAALWRLVASAQERTRRLGLAALSVAGAGPDDQRALLDRLRDGDADWNRRVLIVFERWGAPSAQGAERTAALLAQFVGSGKVARADALSYSAERRLPKWSALVEQSLNSPDPRVQAAALDAIERPASDEAVRTVRRLRRAADPLVRAGAYVALGRMAVSSEVDALRAGLDDPEPAVRRAAVVGLGLTADPKAVQPLLTALGDAQTPVAELAGRSLEALTAWSTPWPSKATAEALDQYRGQWSRWWNTHREEGQHVWLRAAIDSGDPARRAIAARSLARALDPTARALLDHALRVAAPAERAEWGLDPNGLARTSGSAVSDSGSAVPSMDASAEAWLALARTAPPELALGCVEAALSQGRRADTSARPPTSAMDLLVRGFGPKEPAMVAQRRRALLAQEFGFDGADDDAYSQWWLAARPFWTAR